MMISNCNSQFTECTTTNEALNPHSKSTGDFFYSHIFRSKSKKKSIDMHSVRKWFDNLKVNSIRCSTHCLKYSVWGCTISCNVFFESWKNAMFQNNGKAKQCRMWMGAIKIRTNRNIAKYHSEIIMLSQQRVQSILKE